MSHSLVKVPAKTVVVAEAQRSPSLVPRGGVRANPFTAGAAGAHLPEPSARPRSLKRPRAPTAARAAGTDAGGAAGTDAGRRCRACVVGAQRLDDDTEQLPQSRVQSPVRCSNAVD